MSLNSRALMTSKNWHRFPKAVLPLRKINTVLVLASNNNNNNASSSDVYNKFIASLPLSPVTLSDFLSNYLRYKFSVLYHHILGFFVTPKFTIMIPEFDRLDYNHMYQLVNVYLAGKINSSTMGKSEGEKNFKIKKPENEYIEDVFEGTQFLWRLVCVVKKEKEENNHPIMDAVKDVVDSSCNVRRSFYLTFNLAEKKKALESYLPHIITFLKAKENAAAALPPPAKSETATIAAAGVAKGTYVPPSQRAGADRSGQEMRRINDENSVCVTNLSEDTREPDLQDLFSTFGPVSHVYIVYDQKTGMSRGFGFVNFVHKGDAEKAIAKLNGYGYDNLILRVEWAAPRAT